MLSFYQAEEVHYASSHSMFYSLKLHTTESHKSDNLIFNGSYESDLDMKVNDTKDLNDSNWDLESNRLLIYVSF